MEIIYKGKKIDTDSLGVIMKNNVDLMTYLEYLMEANDKVNTESANAQYIYIGRRHAIRDLIKLTEEPANRKQRQTTKRNI